VPMTSPTSSGTLPLTPLMKTLPAVLALHLELAVRDLDLAVLLDRRVHVHRQLAALGLDALQLDRARRRLHVELRQAAGVEVDVDPAVVVELHAVHDELAVVLAHAVAVDRAPRAVAAPHLHHAAAGQQRQQPGGQRQDGSRAHCHGRHRFTSRAPARRPEPVAAGRDGRPV
jgi:hypothetical protein